jgi:iron complex outermembrane receptor protein
VSGRYVVAASSTDAQRLREARTHYEKAISHYNLDEFEPALEEFREAYRFKPDPSFLFNIAQCYRKLGQRDAAIDFYRKYVRASPDAANRAEAERRIAELKAQGDDAARAPAANGAVVAPPAATVVAPVDLSAPPPASSSPSAPPALSLASSASPTASLAASPTSEPASAGTPAFYKRWWFWVALGAVAAGATVAAVTLGSSAQTPYAGTIPPGTAHVPTN